MLIIPRATRVTDLLGEQGQGGGGQKTFTGGIKIAESIMRWEGETEIVFPKMKPTRIK